MRPAVNRRPLKGRGSIPLPRARIDGGMDWSWHPARSHKPTTGVRILLPPPRSRSGAVWPARLAHNQEVAGSNPASATSFDRGVAQRPERRSPKPGVGGSTPSTPAKVERPVVQRPERPPDKRKVVGSNPTGTTSLSGCKSVWSDGLPWKQEDGGSNPSTQTKMMVAVVQLEERLFVTQEVVGSNPIGHPKRGSPRMVDMETSGPALRGVLPAGE